MNKIFGIHSFLMVISAYIMAGIVIIFNNLVFGISYLILIPLCFLCVAFFYCTKCECRIQNCGHFFLGQLTRILPRRKASKYTIFDIIGALSPVLVLILLPQYWLWKNKILFIIFWILHFVAFIEIYFFVCEKCGNKKCSMCKFRAIKE